MKIVRTTTSYQIELPADVREDQDGRATSFWRDGESLLLQLSSYLRNDGEQVSAQVRLEERIARTPAAWAPMPGRLCPKAAIDEAAAFYRDGATVWVFAYFVWPHLTVFATLSGSEADIFDDKNWARQGIQSISLTLQ